MKRVTWSMTSRIKRRIAIPRRYRTSPTRGSLPYPADVAQPHPAGRLYGRIKVAVKHAATGFVPPALRFLQRERDRLSAGQYQARGAAQRPVVTADEFRVA